MPGWSGQHTLGDRKTALFLIMSDTDTTFNFVIAMLQSQLFNLLCDKADDVYGGRLPVHVRCLLDEFANIGQIPNFDKLIATIRSREISASIIFDCGGHTFTAKGKQVLSQGWRAIQEVFRSSLKEKPENEDAEGVLPALTEGQVFEPVSASVTEHFTSPPKPYTEDTLLSAMENAGKEDMPDEAERKGLGTPATRAAIIEKLVSGGFVERKGKNLIPTKAGINLVTVLPELLTSPKLTADWEQQLNEVAKGQASPEDFMDGIEAMAAELVRKYSHISEDGQKLFQPEKETVGLCPRCGKPVYEGKKNFACSDRACQFVMWKNDRFWTSRRKEMTWKMAADLLKKGRTSVKGMWSEKKGSTYDAVVILDDTGGKYVNFKLEFPKRKDGVHGKK